LESPTDFHRYASRRPCRRVRRLRRRYSQPLPVSAPESALEQVFTPVPLTLPAHVFTAMYPPANGVPDNGELLPSSVAVLAEHPHAHEFDTAAFVGAFVLDRRFGLARGFHEYWGESPLYHYGGLDPTTFSIPWRLCRTGCGRVDRQSSLASLFRLCPFL